MENQILQFVAEMREVEATRRQIDQGFQQVRQSYRAKRKALQERHEALMANILADPAEQSPLFAHAERAAAGAPAPDQHATIQQQQKDLDFIAMGGAFKPGLL